MSELWPVHATMSCEVCNSLFCSPNCSSLFGCSSGSNLCRMRAKRQDDFQKLSEYCRSGLCDSLANIREYPMLAFRLLVMILCSARPPDQDSIFAGTEPRQGLSLEDAEKSVLGGLALVPDAHLPEFDYAALAGMCRAAACESAAEAEWVTDEMIRRLVAISAANAIRCRPLSPFDEYMRRVRGGLPWDERRRAVDTIRKHCSERVRAAAAADGCDGGGAAAPDPGQIDAAVWALCGVPAAAIYRLQSKCNHDCDANAQARAHRRAAHISGYAVAVRAGVGR